MNNDLISIIVPIYNAELHIAKCMDCVRNQSYDNLEIIVVNDGSTDKSDQICKEYLKKDVRIHYFTKRNGGPASARNEGIRRAKGKYLYFMDVDDILDKYAIEILYKAYHKDEFDFVIGNTKRIDIYGNERLEWKGEDQVFEDRGSVKELVYNFANDIKSYKILWSAWGKLYRADIIFDLELYYNERVYAWEDVLFVMSYLAHCKSVYYVGACLYTYVHCGQANIASNNSYLGPMDFRYTIRIIKKILRGQKYERVIRNCYSEYSIWSMFNNVRLMKINSVGDLRKLYFNIWRIVKSQELQQSIDSYVQKHNDNAKIIPFLIKRKWVWLIIVVFGMQINKNKK